MIDTNPRDRFAREALAQIPKILTLQDRNPHSPTYGCFDRNFWHYKIIDFPSGMAAEFVWPLALAWALDIPDNPYYRNESIREWAEAGILYAARSAHADGSCDDYFPYEKAAGAAAFSLLACMEAVLLLGLEKSPKYGAMLDFFGRRADWLADHHESGRLTNHQALIVLCLEKVARLIGSDRWAKLREKRILRVLEWQDDEGWFAEYEGADPGYHTLTIGLLAQVYEIRPSSQLKRAIENAVRFASEFVHPDGSFGGEYTSRNTYNFFPHGFEIVGKWMPDALTINDQFLTGLEAGLAPCYADDHIIGHHCWSYLLAWQHYVQNRRSAWPRTEGRIHFKRAGILIERRGDSELYLALNKGGVFKFFKGGKLVHSDTQFSARVKDGGKTRNAVAHMVGTYQVDLRESEITISGNLGWAKTKQMTTFNLMALRMLMLTAGRFFPDLVRQLLQQILITGKKPAPLTFTRRLRWEGHNLFIADSLRAKSWPNVSEVGMGASQTSIYVVMSRTFQRGQMQPWTDVSERITNLAPDAPLVVERLL